MAGAVLAFALLGGCVDDGDVPNADGDSSGQKRGDPNAPNADGTGGDPNGDPNTPDPNAAPDPDPGEDEEVGSTLLGVGSASTSLKDFPKTAPTTTGDYYVDVAKGSDSNDGKSVDKPFKTIKKALSVVQDGQTILAREGTYKLSSQIQRSTGWTKGIRVFNYGTELPVLDASSLPTNNEGTGAAVRLAAGSAREHWKGFLILDAPSFTMLVQGVEHVVEGIVGIGNGQGIQVADFGSGAKNNLVQDCAVLKLGDGTSTHTNVPDAFSATANVGKHTTGNKFVRVVGANSPDDNYDLFRARDTLVLDSVSIGGGTYWNGNSGGDGGGFKMGGVEGSDNTLKGSVSVHTRAQSVLSNQAPASVGSIHYDNVTSVNAAYGLEFGSTNGDTATNFLTLFHKTRKVGFKGNETASFNSWQVDVTEENVVFAAPDDGDWSLAPGSAAIGAGKDKANLGASVVALELLKKWWNHSAIYVPGRGAGPGGTGLPGDTP